MTAIRRATIALASVGLVAACSSDKPKSAPTSAAAYHATATLSVTTTGDASSAANTIAQLATSEPALRAVINDLHLGLSVDELKTHITAAASGSNQVRIVADATDAARAAELANADANAVRQLGPGAVAGAQVAVVQPAAVPTK